MSICPASDVSFSKEGSSPDYYLKPYTSVPAFTSIPPANNVIKADGTVDSTALNSWVDTLVTSMAKPPTTIDPDNTANPAQDFANNATLLRENIKKEYCYYYNRYIWSLNTVLTNATSSGGVVDPVLKEGAQQLNGKLNTILLVMKALINSRNNTLNTYYNDTHKGVNHLNTQLDKARTDLKNHSMKLQKNDLDSDIQAAMIEYTLEKNSSSRNLLAVYGFMNIVAAGLLFYIYTKTKA